MMDQQKIERYVEDLLTVSGILKDGAEQPVWLLLHHLYSAVAMYELMNPQQRSLIAGIQRKLRYFFDAKCDLKERKRKQEKENTPPHPLYKEKARKEKAEKTNERAESGVSRSLDDLSVRNACSIAGNTTMSRWPTSTTIGLRKARRRERCCSKWRNRGTQHSAWLAGTTISIHPQQPLQPSD